MAEAAPAAGPAPADVAATEDTSPPLAEEGSPAGSRPGSPAMSPSAGGKKAAAAAKLKPLSLGETPQRRHEALRRHTMPSPLPSPSMSHFQPKTALTPVEARGVIPEDATRSTPRVLRADGSPLPGRRQSAFGVDRTGPVGAGGGIGGVAAAPTAAGGAGAGSGANPFALSPIPQVTRAEQRRRIKDLEHKMMEPAGVALAPTARKRRSVAKPLTHPPTLGPIALGAVPTPSPGSGGSNGSPSSLAPLVGPSAVAPGAGAGAGAGGGGGGGLPPRRVPRHMPHLSPKRSPDSVGSSVELGGPGPALAPMAAPAGGLAPVPTASMGMGSGGGTKRSKKKARIAALAPVKPVTDLPAHAPSALDTPKVPPSSHLPSMGAKP